jgi:prephenate dehydrogenase
MSQADSISFNRVTIVGPGLLGASIGMALKEKKLAKEVWAHLRDEEKKESCQSTIWCDRALVDLQESVSGSDLIILCTPVDIILEQLKKISKWIQPGCLLTDIGSLKHDICMAAESYLLNDHASFIGSHPMTGSEKSGIDYAHASIFLGKTCLLTPRKQTHLSQVHKIETMWNALGMKVIKLDSAEHDEIVAWVSHLPHVMASAIVNTFKGKDENWITLSGNGLKDTTRIASGNPEMWKQILLGNRKNLIDSIDQLIAQLNDLKESLTKSDDVEVLEFLRSAKKMRDKLND